MKPKVKRYHYFLVALLVLSGTLAWLQVERQAYRSIERQCAWQLAQFSAIRSSNLSYAEMVDFQRLASELAEMQLLLADTRARLKLLTDNRVGTANDTQHLIEALRQSEKHIQEIRPDNGLAKSSEQLRDLAEKAEKESELSEQICDAAEEAQDRYLFLEGVLTVMMTALAFYAGRKSLE